VVSIPDLPQFCSPQPKDYKQKLQAIKNLLSIYLCGNLHQLFGCLQFILQTAQARGSLRRPFYHGPVGNPTTTTDRLKTFFELLFTGKQLVFEPADLPEQKMPVELGRFDHHQIEVLSNCVNQCCDLP